MDPPPGFMDAVDALPILSAEDIGKICADYDEEDDETNGDSDDEDDQQGSTDGSAAKDDDNDDDNEAGESHNEMTTETALLETNDRRHLRNRERSPTRP